MTAHPLKPSALPNLSGPIKAHDKRRRRQTDIDIFLEALSKTRPERGLLTLITDNWNDGAFQAAINEMAPMKRIPDEIRKFLVARAINDDQRIAFLRVVFAQADNQFHPVYRLPNWPLNCPDTARKFIEDIKAATKKSRPKGFRRRRAGNRGIVDPSYPWHNDTPHKLTEVASALGLTVEGLRKRCRAQGIKVNLSKVKRRSSTISAKDAFDLLIIQLQKPINRELKVGEKVIKKLKLELELIPDGNRKMDPLEYSIFGPSYALLPGFAKKFR